MINWVTLFIFFGGLIAFFIGELLVFAWFTLMGKIICEDDSYLIAGWLTALFNGCLWCFFVMKGIL